MLISSKYLKINGKDKKELRERRVGGRRRKKRNERKMKKEEGRSGGAVAGSCQLGNLGPTEVYGWFHQATGKSQV